MEEEQHITERRIDITEQCMRDSIRWALDSLIDAGEERLQHEDEGIFFIGLVWASVGDQLPALLDELDTLRARVNS